MNTRSIVKVGCLALAALIWDNSAAHAEPSIPVENRSDRYMKLLVKVPGGSTTPMELNKGDKKQLDLSTPGFYDLSVSDADNRTAVIGRYDLRRELALNAKVAIIITAKFTKAEDPSAKEDYIGPAGWLVQPLDLGEAAREGLQPRLAEAMQQMVKHSLNGFTDIKGNPYADKRFVSKLAFPGTVSTLMLPDKYASALFMAETKDQLEQSTDVLISVAAKTFPDWKVTHERKNASPTSYRLYYLSNPQNSRQIMISADRDAQGRYYGYITFYITDGK